MVFHKNRVYVLVVVKIWGQGAEVKPMFARVHRKQRHLVPKRGIGFGQIGHGNGPAVFERIGEFVAELEDAQPLER